MGWDGVRQFVNKDWDPENGPHHSIIGLTGSGKSFLAINGILKPLCKQDRVLIIDSKRDDKLVRSVGKPVSELPRRTWYTGMGRRNEDYKSWYRLVLQGDSDNKRRQVAHALAKVYREGNWIVYIDELKHVTGLQRPFLRLGPQVDEVYILGRSRLVSIIAGTQSPKHVPTSFYDQATYAWIGRIRDEERQKRLLEIGGLSRKELTYISTLKNREWLLSAGNGEFFARTTVTAP
jgi:hypothetical protein